MARLLVLRVLDTNPNAPEPVENIITLDLDAIDLAHSGDRIAAAWSVGDTLQMWMKDRAGEAALPRAYEQTQ